MKAMTKDIVATATAAGSFGTLLTAATAAGLVETLQGAGPFTVFAPTDEAFAALPAGTLDSLLADPEALKKVLLYHVVSGKVTSDQVVELTSADSVEGSPIAISVKDGKVYLNDSAQVVTADVEASNGVIHVIDQVLLPPAARPAPRRPRARRRATSSRRPRRRHVHHPPQGRHGGRPGRDAQGRRPVHRLRPDRRGLRRAAGRHARRAS